MSSQRSARKRNAAPYQQQQDSGHPAEGGPPSADGSEGGQQWSPMEHPQNDQDVDEYALKRLRNNAAVSRTRQKKRMEQAHTSQRVKELREENAQLERTLDTMRRELALLKEMVVVCAAKGDGSATTN